MNLLTWKFIRCLLINKFRNCFLCLSSLKTQRVATQLVYRMFTSTQLRYALTQGKARWNPCFDVSFHIFAPRLGSWIDHIATRIEKGLPLEMKECPPLETMSVTCAHESLMEESSILLQVCCNSEIIPLAQENPAPPFQCLESVNVLEQPGGGGARTTTAATVRRNCPGDWGSRADEAIGAVLSWKYFQHLDWRDFYRRTMSQFRGSPYKGQQAKSV